MRVALLDELQKNSPFTVEEFEDVLDKEFSIFKAGEKYDFPTDMKRAYSESLAKSSIMKIFETLPDHVFWDVKKPQMGTHQKYINPNNPFRQYPFDSFFDMLDNEAYNDRRNLKHNLNDATAIYRKYWAAFGYATAVLI